MKKHRFLLLVLSPIWLTVAFLSISIGLAVFSGSDPAGTMAIAFEANTIEEAKLITLGMRIILFPFQIIFISLMMWVALWVFRRRKRIARWVVGDSLAKRLTTQLATGEIPTVLHPDRQRTLQQVVSSAIAIAAFTGAALLSLGQFMSREDLAVVIAALTSSLAWGARLPIGDLLGGISNIFENNLAVGDRIAYRQVDSTVDGTVETVDLRYLSVRAQNGELTSIPFDNLRVFRNYSRGDYIGVYAVFPIAAADLSRAVALLTELEPQSTELVPHLVEPWQPMSLEGEMGAVIDLTLFGKTKEDLEDDLQLALHTLVRNRFAADGIKLIGKERATN